MGVGREACEGEEGLAQGPTGEEHLDGILVQSPLAPGGHCSEQCLFGEHEAQEVGVRVQVDDALHLCFAKPVEPSRQTVVQERPRDPTCYMM